MSQKAPQPQRGVLCLSAVVAEAPPDASSCQVSTLDQALALLQKHSLLSNVVPMIDVCYDLHYDPILHMLQRSNDHMLICISSATFFSAHLLSVVKHL